MKINFKTEKGIVYLSGSFTKLGCDKPKTDITYKPDNYNGWGIVKTVNANDVRFFTKEDAEYFAIDAELKLRVN